MSRRGEPLSLRVLVAHLRKFGRREFVTVLAAHARRCYLSDPQPGVLQGGEPWLVAGVAALALMRCYPSGIAPTSADVEQACRMFFGLERPHAAGHDLALERLIIPELYRQGPYQRWMLGEIARPIALFDTRSWKRVGSPAVITAEWEEELLACTVVDFCLAGFVLHAAAMKGSHFPLAEGEGAAAIHDAFGGREAFEAVVARHYVGDVEWFRAERFAAVEASNKSHDDPATAEPFVFNPLVKHPLLTGLVDGLAIAPAPAEIVRRASVEGIVHEGLARHGGAFTGEVGYFFEGYIGRQLEGIEGADVYPEITYSTQHGEVATVDWIVVLPGAVLLIECKSALPRRDVVEGWETFREGHEQAIKGRRQLVETATAIRSAEQPKLAAIPTDRPMAGLVITLGSFYAANESVVVGEASTDLAVGVVDAEFLESLVTLSGRDLETFVRRMAEVPAGGHLEPRDLLDGLGFRPNPLLTSVFDSLPLLRDIPMPDAADE